LRELPGVGRYTAAAIASIAFDEPTAVVDGNVERVLSRILGRSISGERVWNVAGELLCRENAGDFNQAMMELGATVCLPGEPKCVECPVRKFCRTRGRHRTTAKPPQRKVEIAYALERKPGHVLLVQRKNHESLMPGLWELPQVAMEAADELLFSVRHSITVTDYRVRIVSRTNMHGTWVKSSRIAALPLTGLTKKILWRAGIIEMGSPLRKRGLP